MTTAQHSHIHPKTRASKHAPRQRAREFAVQALYQFHVGKCTADEADSHTRSLRGFHKSDAVHFEALLHGCTAHLVELHAIMQGALDRPIKDISPIELIILWIGIYEMQHCLDIPWKVVINECVDLAKTFGGTDGHKYINGVLNKLVRQLRALELQAHQTRSPT